MGLSLLSGALWVALALRAPRTYTAETAFIPQSRSSGTNLPGFAAQLGINLGSSDGSSSPDFFVDLVRSRMILHPVARDSFDFRDAGGRAVRGTLAQFYGLAGETPALATESVIRRLQQDVAAGANIKTGVVTVRVQATQSAVAAQIADRLLAEVHEFNIRSRQRQAAADRRFAEQRLAELRQELRLAEDRLQSFLEANRNTTTPRLTLQLERLQRDVMMQQTLYTALAQSYGQAKMEELRDTPAIATVEAPEAPVLPDKRQLPLKAFVGLLLGAMLGIVFGFVSDYFSRTREAAPGDFDEFAKLRRAAVDDVLHPWRPIRRVIRRRPE